MVDVKTRVWNARLALAARILPGDHKHWEAYDTKAGEVCETCKRRSELRSLLGQAIGKV